jgi:hypothetical protein
MFYKWFYLWKIITNYLDLRKLWNHLRWFHNSEALAATLSLPSLALEPNPFAPHSWCRIRGRCPPLCQCGSGTPEPRTNHWRVADSNPTPLPHRLPFLHLCLPSLLLRAYPLSLRLASCCEMRAMPCACNWMPRVMDGRAVSRGLCFTHGNPALQPSYFAMDNTVSPTHTSLRSEHSLSHHPLLSITRRSFHPFHAVAAYLGMIMPFLVYLHLALLSSSVALTLQSSVS